MIFHLSANLKFDIGFDKLAVLLIEPHYFGRTRAAVQQPHKLHDGICVALDFALHLNVSA